MKNLKQLYLVILAVALCCAMAGNGLCSETNLLAEGERLPVDLGQLVFDQAAKSLSGRFNAGETTILFETRRGDRIADALILADPSPNPRLYEMDILMSDAKTGMPFFLQTGGDRTIDPLWEDRMAETAPFDSEELAAGAALYKAACQLVETLGGLPLKPELLPERQAFEKMLPLITALAEEAREKPLRAEAQTSAACHFYVEIQYHDLFNLPTIHHSATKTKRFDSNWNLTRTWVTCNHGSCAGDANMRYKCGKWRDDSCDMISEMPNCQTLYGFGPGTHVCNDDSAVQYQKAAYNPWYLTVYGGTCADSWLRDEAPDCW